MYYTIESSTSEFKTILTEVLTNPLATFKQYPNKKTIKYQVNQVPLHVFTKKRFVTLSLSEARLGQSAVWNDIFCEYEIPVYLKQNTIRQFVARSSEKMFHTKCDR